MAPRKSCPKCKGREFYANGKCKPCYRAYLKVYMKAYRAAGRDEAHNRRSGIRGKVNRNAIKRRLLEELGISTCQRCGFDALVPGQLPAIDFHHRDHTAKLFSLSGGSYGRRFEALLAEAQKCDVLCANCHRIHHEEHGYVRAGREPKPEVDS